MLHSRGTRGNVERKVFLYRRGIIRCDRCPYHRGENAYGHRPRPDAYKNHRRAR